MNKRLIFRWMVLAAALAILLSCNIPESTDASIAQRQTAFEVHAQETAGMVLTMQNLAETPPAQSLESPAAPLPADIALTQTQDAAAAQTQAVPFTLTSSPFYATYSDPAQASATWTPAATAIPATAASTNTVSSAPTKTSTLTPAATLSSECTRETRLFKSIYWAAGPTLDGDLLDWSDQGYYIRNVVYGTDQWAGDYDLSGTFRARWNEKYLFLAATIQDERYNQHETSWQLYLGDSLELFIDANLCGDLDKVEMDSDDYQIGVSPGYADTSGSRDVYRWFPQPGGSMSEVSVGSARLPDDTTIYEVRIPWTSLGISSPKAGLRLGFVFSVSDDDDPGGEARQETILSTVDYRSFNPKTWTMLVLQQ